MEEKKENSAAGTLAAKTSGELVARSQVPAVTDYKDYKSFLRRDFFHSCAYCTLSEAEAQAVRFAIDHYEPQNIRPELKNQYSNLMYACEPCNSRKGDRSPPEAARRDGYRFFRPDEDARSEHFSISNNEIAKKTNTGDFTIEALDLNRQTLKRIRDIRRRLTECAPLVAAGIMALRDFRIDQLPKGIRSSAIKAIANAESAEKQLTEQIDAMLLNYARSHLLDEDSSTIEKSRLEERAEKLREMQGLYPGKWRGDRKKSTTKPRR